MKNLGLLILLIIFCNKVFSQTTTVAKDTVMAGSIAKNYRGGFESYNKYISRRALPPALAHENQISGSVRIAFIIEPDGSLTNIHATTHVGYGMEDNAIKVIKQSTGWLSSVIDGKNVRTSVEVGVKFTNQGNTAWVEGENVN